MSFPHLELCVKYDWQVKALNPFYPIISFQYSILFALIHAVKQKNFVVP